MDKALCVSCVSRRGALLSRFSCFILNILHCASYTFKPLYSWFVSVPEWAESAGGQCGHCMQGGETGGGGQNKRVSRDWPGSE